MPAQSQAPYWIDDLGRKHEGWPYDESNAETISIKHEGQALRLIVPTSTPPVDVMVTAQCGELLFLIGTQLAQECEDGYIIEGGDGILMVARRHPEKDDTYWLIVRHDLFESTLRRLTPDSRVDAT
ncbi:MAG: hypothetical protein ACP5XB_13325 [Isosphaeraceae bacterium]